MGLDKDGIRFLLGAHLHTGTYLYIWVVTQKYFKNISSSWGRFATIYSLKSIVGVYTEGGGKTIWNLK